MANQEKNSKKLLFLSDAHLGGFDKRKNLQIESELLHLIGFCQKNNYKLYVLGDLFDYWMEYPQQLPAIAVRLRRRFKTYNKNFGPTLYITGNHDNWTRGYFKSIGFDVEKNHRFLQLDSQKILLLHGDGLDDVSMNLPRPLFHRLLRHPTFIAGYQRLLPAGWGLKVMKYFSRFTRSAQNSRLDQKMLNKWAEKKLKHTDVDTIICGHDHLPRVRNFDFGTLINLGTFYQHKSLATYNNGNFSLVTWNDTTRELKPFYP